MLKAGERAPEFTLPDDTGTDRSLTELLSSGAIVLYFYPADFTPGCTRQACVFRDLHEEVQRAGLRVVGISPQSPESHAKFRAKYNLPFVLLSDQHKAVVKMYGVNGPLGIGVRRASYLIDGGRRIRDCGPGGFQDRQARGFHSQGNSIAAAQILNSSSAAHWRDRCAAPSRCTRSRIPVSSIGGISLRPDKAATICGTVLTCPMIITRLPLFSRSTRCASPLGSSLGATMGTIPSRAASGAAVIWLRTVEDT